MSKTTLSWLHISDIHVRESQAWSQDVVLSSLLEDIKTRYGPTGPDLIFITGDIAFSGKPKEYEIAEEFVRKLLAAVRLSADRLAAVPGNHDIDREVSEDAFHGCRLRLKSSIEVDRFFASEDRRRTMFA